TSRFPPTCRRATSSTSATPAPTRRPTRASSTAFPCRKSGFSSPRSSRLVQDEVELHPVGRDMLLALGFLPARAVVRRKPSVAFEVLVDFGHHQTGRGRQRLREQAAAADHKGHRLAQT